MRSLAALVALATALGRAGELRLTVDWGGASRPRPFPVTGGVPLAKGALKDPRAARLVAHGRAVPLQTEALARWPDGSVKWLLLDFQAPTGETRFTLRFANKHNRKRSIILH